MGKLATFVVVAVSASLPLSLALADTKSPAKPGAKSFEDAEIWRIEITLDPEEYAAMQPPPGGGFFGPPPAAPPAPIPPAKNGEPREVFRNLFGTQFPWAEATLALGDSKYEKVGLRYAGDGTYFTAAGSLKRSFRVDFGRFGEAPSGNFKVLNLHCNALDPTQGREWLALQACQAGDIAAPRAGLAEVTLTVPGQFDKELLGLYTVVEEVDEAFLRNRFGTSDGLLCKPVRMQGLDFLGDAWARYTPTYQPARDATPAEAKRVIELARLINQADDAEFKRRIGGEIDVEAFLRYLGAHALLANVSHFASLGTNYYLYLPSETGKFVFVPEEMELALANFQFMGTAEQLMNLSLAKPYPNANKLADRLLADENYGARYREILQELTGTMLDQEKLFAHIAAFEKTTGELLTREQAATAARLALAPPVAGPPGGGGGMYGPPPDLRTFVRKRNASVGAQLAGISEGYVPQFSFGPPPAAGGGGPPQAPADVPLNDETIAEHVKAPEGFHVTLFAAPPIVNYPVAVAASPSGAIFVASDEQGSLGRTAGGGKVYRCLDIDGDGKAEKVNVFARMEHPRGVVAQDDAVWVLHPPLLSVFRDRDGDGVADEQETLVTGLTTELIDTRGGDHTTNGIRLGIDGWLYIAAGDYGIREAKGRDGSTIQSRGGCIARVRPDGTELEVVARGFRNPFDIAIDPRLDLFTRDNTNDGGGWDVRVSHILPGAHYGYTQLYANFADEIMPALGSFGGGGGTGALYIEDERWPEAYNAALYTGDWGRSEIYRHKLTPQGASYAANQEVFLTIARATGMDLDHSGRLIAASWRGGDASVFVGPDVGFLAAIVPQGWKPEPPLDHQKATAKELIARFSSKNAVVRLASQRELLRRGPSAEATSALTEAAIDDAAPEHSRMTAIFALKQLDGEASHETLLKLVADRSVREFALKALPDRKSQLEGVSPAVFVEALDDESPRVVARAIEGLVRLGDASAAEKLVALTTRTGEPSLEADVPLHMRPDAGRAIPHLATRALISLGAIDACLAAIDGPHAEGALRGLRSMHDERAAEGLIKKLATTYNAATRREILATLIRLYYREADYDGSWWGIRPDNSGPYYDRREWNASPRIGAVIARAYADADAETADYLRGQLAKHQVYFKGLPTKAELASAKPAEVERPIVVAKADPANPEQIGNRQYADVVAATLGGLQSGDSTSAERGKELFGSLSCRACHTEADGQTPKGPHMVDIGKRYKAPELAESILKPSEKIAQGFESYAFELADGRVVSGFVVRESAGGVTIRDLEGVPREFASEEIDNRSRLPQSAMPQGIADALTPAQLADLIAYLQTL